ncbi:MAG: hypothetical protein ACOCRX_07415 [Candidatus Woesearchaeota archaeon]
MSYETSVPGVQADDVVKYGIDEYPLFDVDYNTFDAAKKGKRFIPRGEDNLSNYLDNIGVNRKFYVR